MEGETNQREILEAKIVFRFADGLWTEFSAFLLM